MLFACLKKEVLLHLASFRFWVGTVLAVVLAAAATWVAARDYELRRERYQDRVAAHAEELRKVSVYSFLQPLAVRPPEPLSLLDRGFDARLGTDVRVHLFAVPSEASGGSQGNELLAAQPAADMDLTAIVAVVLGLLALLLACDAVIGEREGGTLRTLLAQGVRRRTVLAGKVWGGLLTLCLPLLATFAVSATVLAGTVGLALFAGRVSRILALLASYLAYLALMFLLGLFVSLRAASSSRALVASVLIWLAAVIVLPAVAWSVAADLVGTQEAADEAAAGSRSLAAAWSERVKAERARHPLLQAVSGHTAISFANGPHRAVRFRNGSAAYYDALAEHYRFEAASGIEHAERLFAVERRYEAKLLQGERLGQALAFVSPAFLLDRLSESLAGTSLADYDAFLAACRAYRRALIDDFGRRDALGSWRWFTDDDPDRLYPWPRFLGLAVEEVEPAQVRTLFNRLSSTEVQPLVESHRGAVETDRSRRLDPAGLPRLVLTAPDLGACLRRAAVEGSALLALLILLTAAVGYRFARYEVG